VLQVWRGISYNSSLIQCIDAFRLRLWHSVCASMLMEAWATLVPVSISIQSYDVKHFFVKHVTQFQVMSTLVITIKFRCQISEGSATTRCACNLYMHIVYALLLTLLDTLLSPSSSGRTLISWDMTTLKPKEGRVLTYFGLLCYVVNVKYLDHKVKNIMSWITTWSRLS